MEDSAGMTPRPGCQVRGMISFPRTWKGAGSFVIGSPQDTVSCFLPTTGQRFCWAVKPTEKIKSNLFLPSFYSAAWPPPRPPPHPRGRASEGQMIFPLFIFFCITWTCVCVCGCVCGYLCVCAHECIFFPPFLCILNNTSWLAIPSQGLWCHSNLSAGWVASNMVQASCFAIYNVYLPLPLRIKLWSFVDRVCTNFSSVLWRRR